MLQQLGGLGRSGLHVRTVSQCLSDHLVDVRATLRLFDTLCRALHGSPLPPMTIKERASCAHAVPGNESLDIRRLSEPNYNGTCACPIGHSSHRPHFFSAAATSGGATCDCAAAADTTSSAPPTNVRGRGCRAELARLRANSAPCPQPPRSFRLAGRGFIIY